MFNPKENLLDQQLAVSGLEMNITWAGVGAIASIAGGIFGASSASRQNAEARRAQQKQEQAAQEAADIANKYNAEAFKIDQENYYNNRAFQRELQLDSWRYNQQIQDIQYQQVVSEYAKSVENTENQLAFNSMAAIDAYSAEQSALNEIFIEDAFNRQGDLVDRLQQEGRAQLGQAGVSRNKAIQSRLAGIGRNAAIQDASLASSVEQSQRNMRQISMQKYGADLAARAEMMIRPQAIPDIPQPKEAPERVFIAPMQATPTYIPPAVQQSTAAPIFSSIASVNWKEVFTT